MKEGKSNHEQPISWVLKYATIGPKTRYLYPVLLHNIQFNFTKVPVVIPDSVLYKSPRWNLITNVLQGVYMAISQDSRPQYKTMM